MSAKKKRRAFRVRAPIDAPRRQFLAQGVGLAAVGFLIALRHWQARPVVSSKIPIRPPTASADDTTFQRQCIRCGLCGTVCENGCIRFYGSDQSEHGAFSPYLDVRQRSCTLCMRCTQVCPSGALSAVEKEPKAIQKHVRMGLAVVDPEHCISYQGRLCGYCHDACPIPQIAIRLTPPALPVVLDACVGCGRCVEFCPQEPTAIRVERRSA